MGSSDGVAANSYEIRIRGRVGDSVLAAIALAGQGVLRRGALRAMLLVPAAACLVAGIVILLGQDPLDTVFLVLTAVASVACARAAIVPRAHLPPAPRPARPVLIYNPRSGGGKAEKFNLPAEARRRRIEPVEMKPDLEKLTKELVAQGVAAI